METLKEIVVAGAVVIFFALLAVVLWFLFKFRKLIRAICKIFGIDFGDFSGDDDSKK